MHLSSLTRYHALTQRIAFYAVLTITNLLSMESIATAEVDAANRSKAIAVRASQFCDGISSSLQRFAQQKGAARRPAMQFASKASQGIEKQLKSGTFEEYYDVTSLMRSSLISVSPENRQWLSIPEILVTSLGHQPKRVLVVEQVDDLKMLPHVAPESQLLVLASSLGSLDAQRARIVAEAAQFGKIQINIIWVGRLAAGDHRSLIEPLAFLAGATGGAFVDFSRANACPGV